MHTNVYSCYPPPRVLFTTKSSILFKLNGSALFPQYQGASPGVYFKIMFLYIYIALISNFIYKALLTATATQIHLHLGHLTDAFIQSDLQKIHLSEERETIYRCWYSKYRTKCPSLTIARLTHSLYTTKMARIRCYTMLSTILSKDVQHTISG